MVDIYLTWLAVLALVIGVGIGMFFIVGGDQVYSPSYSKQYSIAPKTGKLVEGFANNPGKSGFLEVKEIDVSFSTVNTSASTNATKIHQFDDNHVLVAWLDTDTQSPLNLNLTLFRKGEDYGQYYIKNTEVISVAPTNSAYNTFHFLVLDNGTVTLFYPSSNNLMTFGHLTIENEKVQITDYATTLTYSNTVPYQGVMLSQDKQSIYTYSYVLAGTTTLYRLNPDAKGGILNTFSITAPTGIKATDINQGGIFPIAEDRNILMIVDNRITYVLFNDADGGNRIVNRVRDTNSSPNYINVPMKGVKEYEIIVQESYAGSPIPSKRVLTCKVGDSLPPGDDNIISKLTYMSSKTLSFRQPVKLSDTTILYNFYLSSYNMYTMIVDIEKMALLDFHGLNIGTSSSISLGSQLLSDNTLFTAYYGHPHNEANDITSSVVNYGFYIYTYYINPYNMKIHLHPNKGDQPLFTQNGSRSITRKALSNTVQYPKEKFSIGEKYYYRPDGSITKYVLNNNKGEGYQSTIIRFNDSAGIAISQNTLVAIGPIEHDSHVTNHVIV